MWNKKQVSASIVYIPKLITDDINEKTSTNVVTLKECDKAEMTALYIFQSRRGSPYTHFFFYSRRRCPE